MIFLITTFTLLNANKVFSMRSFHECSLFEFGRFCSLDSLIDSVPSINNEVLCQKECSNIEDCKYFLFETLLNGSTDCFLLSECDVTYPCSTVDGCGMTVLGPADPSLADACCEIFFSNATCSSVFMVDEIFHVEGEDLCQNLCRDMEQCRHVEKMDENFI